MRVFHVAVVVLAFATLVGASRLSQPVLAQAPACLHGPGESADQQVRRRQALATARQINSAEAAVKAQTGSYQPLERMSRVITAQGFVAHLAVDANGYAFSIKDSTDPCGFAYFSDQEGIIYTGEAVR